MALAPPISEKKPEVAGTGQNLPTDIIPVSSSARNLGFIFDSDMSFSDQINSVSKSCHFHIRDIRRIRHLFPLSTATALANSLVSSKLDYCNSLYSGISQTNLNKLQRIQNSLARVITNTSKYQHITPTLKKLHWLPIKQLHWLPIKQLRSVRRSLSVNACTALVHAFVTSRLDYCNSLLAGIGDGLIDQLQTVMRVAARLVLRKRKFDPISADIRDRLHWLPIRSRIDFKLGLLVYKCLHGIAPPYLTEMLVLKSTVPALSRLRSTARGDLLVPRTKTKTIGPRSFATSGPALWNKLPDDLRDPSLSLPVFKQRLKSYLFKQC